MGTIDPPVNFIQKKASFRVPFSFGEYNMGITKKELLKINKDYILKYSLDKSFIGKSIVIYSDRYEHFKKHSLEFSSLEEYQNTVENLQDIVCNPDFVRIDANKNGMFFIKTFNDNAMVVVRISASKELKVRTLYPINNTKKDRLNKFL